MITIRLFKSWIIKKPDKLSKRFGSTIFPWSLSVIFILFFCASQSQAEENLREMDFAYGRRIQLGSESPLYQFSLDAHVYRHVANQRLSDLRIFNQEKEPVPLQIRRVPKPASKNLKERHVPIFPFYDEKDSLSGGLTLNLKKNSKEMVFNLNTYDGKSDTNGIAGFIVDLGQEKIQPERIVMDLKYPQKEHRLAVKVAHSTDLSDWRPLVASAALVKMMFKGRLLERKHIDLPSFSSRYLRLSFHKPFKGQLPFNITLLYTKTRRPHFRTTSVKGIRTSTDPVVFTYDSRGFLPTERIQLRLSEVNSLIKARFSTRPNYNVPWRHHKSAIFYRLRINGAELENPPIKLPETQDRLFRFEIIAGSLPKDISVPELLLKWHPHECVFVATGQPPFMLAYGNADLVYEPPVVDDLLEAIGQKNKKTYLGYSRLESPQVLGGDDRLINKVYLKDHWLRMILWAVLLFCVAGLAFMAYRLYRQMKTQP